MAYLEGMNMKKLVTRMIIALVMLIHLPLLSQIELTPIGNYRTGVFAEGAAEIAAHDPATQRLFVVNAFTQTVDVLDISDPTNPTLAFSIDVTPYGKQANSVAVHGGLVAAAVENDSTQLPGNIVFFDADGNYLNHVTAGALPDMVTFTRDGAFALSANEGEPNQDYTHDPEGSVSVVDLRNGVMNATVKVAHFRKYNTRPIPYGVRIFGPNATVAQDLEPEYIATYNNRAFVTCQENNAIAVINIEKARVIRLYGLGFKDHMGLRNGFDASNEDGLIRLKKWPTKGMYQPDAIDIFGTGGQHYMITANEGDSREYLGTPGFVGETRVKDLTLDSTAFPNYRNLQREVNLGRLKVTIANGDTDGDGDYDELYSYGARSFSIWNKEGHLVYDSGSKLERITAMLEPDNFNSDDEENGSFDDRSDDKGPEPEGVVVGKIEGHPFAFVGLERIGGVAVFKLTNPTNPSFVQYINTRDFSGDPLTDTAGDMSPEGLVFIKKSKSPNGKPLLVVTYEVSGSTTIFEINLTGAADRDGAETLEGNNMMNNKIESFNLSQNYPNPFNPETEIRFQIAKDSPVTLKIYNTLGAEIRTVANENFSKGAHTVRWDGRDNFGKPVASGLYFYKIVTNSHIDIKKMHLLR